MQMNKCGCWLLVTFDHDASPQISGKEMEASNWIEEAKSRAFPVCLLLRLQHGPPWSTKLNSHRSRKGACAAFTPTGWQRPEHWGGGSLK